MLESAAVRALLLSLAAGLSTLLGALVVFAARRRSEKLLAVSLGFAGGVMLAVSFTDLFPTAREHLTASLGGRPGALAAVLSLAAGIGCAAALDHLVPHDAFDADTGEAPHKNLFRVGFVSALAMALHNFPEGVATFLAGYEDLTLGVSITLAIALHNIPEGISVAMPVWYATGSRRRAFRCTLLSGLTEPVGAVLAFALLRPFLNGLLLGVLFGAVAGIMVYIAVEELIPSSRQYGHDRPALWATLRDAADPFISNLKRRVYPTLELDYNKLLDMVSEMGYRLMKSGAEIYRVEESIQRLLQAYGAPRGEVFAIPNCLMVSLTSPDGRPVTQIRRMPTHGTDIYLLEKYNGLCRRLCRETPAFEEALEQMEAITRTHRVYSLPTQLAAHFLGCGMFSLFYGGTPADGLCGGLCGMVIGLCMALMTRLGANLFFRTIAGGAASALAAVALTRLGVGQNQDLIIIGALMALVPGIAMTNAMRDIMAGDMVAGISKAAEALLIGAAIALGTALALGLTRMVTGGAL